MLNIKNYQRPGTLEEAWDLMQKSGAKLAAGMMWTRLSGGDIEELIDLQDLGLRYIREDENCFMIGSMSTLRDLETNDSFSSYTCGAAEESLRHIVGVQFRNLATVGGSICGKYGFSDVITLLLPLKATLRFYKSGEMLLSDFLSAKPFKDILIEIRIVKENIKARYCSIRKNFTDFPIINFSMVQAGDDIIRVACGSRPARAELKEFSIANKTPEALAEEIASAYQTGSNARSSAEYRTHLVKVFAERSLRSLEE